MNRHLLLSAACCVLFGLSAQAQEGRYVVLFGFDRADLDATAQATIAAAAQEFQRTGSCQHFGGRSCRHVGQLGLQPGSVGASRAGGGRRADAARRTRVLRFRAKRSAKHSPRCRPATASLKSRIGGSISRLRVPPSAASAGAGTQVVQATPPPPPVPVPRWMFTPGIFYGYNIEDEQGTHSHLAGINLSLDYLVTDWMTFGIEQAGFYHFDTDQDGVGGRTVIWP